MYILPPLPLPQSIAVAGPLDLFQPVRSAQHLAAPQKSTSACPFYLSVTHTKTETPREEVKNVESLPLASPVNNLHPENASKPHTHTHTQLSQRWTMRDSFMNSPPPQVSILLMKSRQQEGQYSGSDPSLKDGHDAELSCNLFNFSPSPQLFSKGQGQW